MTHLAHWDDATAETADLGPIGGTWTELSAAVGSLRLGVNRIEVPAGKAATPQHAEDEEVFYVLGGSGWSVQEGAAPSASAPEAPARDGCFAIGAGDVVYYGAFEPAHTIVAGDDGLDVIAFGTVFPMHAAVRFPRLDMVKAGGLLLSGDTTHQWELEAKLPRIAIADPPDPRPATILNADAMEPLRYEMEAAKADARFLTRGLGARGIALNRADILPGGEAAPLHCHSMEEELFVVLAGDGVLLLGADEEQHPVRAGSVVGRPPGTGVAHAFRAGEQGMTVLMFSDKHPNDMCFYPRTGKVSLRGLGITFQPEIAPW